MSVDAGYLVFLLFIPVLWVLWIWVHISLLPRLCAVVLTSCFTDDRLETRYYIPRVASVLQLSRDVLFRERSRVPGEVESGTL